MHKLKIDRSLISYFATRDSEYGNYKKRLVLDAIIKLAQGFDITILAKGIETQHQLQLIAELGIKELQGFLFSPALGAEDCLKLLSANSVTVGATV